MNFSSLLLAAVALSLVVAVASATAKETIFRGISLDTEWASDAFGSIYTDVSTKSLGLKTAPTYLVSVVPGSSSDVLSMAGLNTKSNFDLSSLMAKLDPLNNVTGTHTARSPTANGFRVRLAYTPEDGRNLTVETAKYGKWRVRWVAITHEHPTFKKLEFEPNSVAAQIKALELLATEEAEVVKGILSTDFQITYTEHVKLEKAKEKARLEKEKKRKEEEEKKKKAEEERKKKKEQEKEKEKKKEETGSDSSSSSKQDK